MRGERHLLTIEAWEHGLKVLHFETFVEPLSEHERAEVDAALRRCGFHDFVATIEARGYTHEEAYRRAAIIMGTELAQLAVDEKAYRRECERRGLLPL